MNLELFKDFVRLERFEMSFGELKSFDLNIFDQTPNLKYIDILGNELTEIKRYTPKTQSVRAANTEKKTIKSEHWTNISLNISKTYVNS